MPQRFTFHFEPHKGWMNDPNGLIYYQGRYHAFFQHNPHEPVWGPMHWGHAVSQDLLHWEELPIALFPDQPYEDDKGCFSGSAVERDGVLYLFYTAVSKQLGQTQCVAVSRDGKAFEKYKGNPVIAAPPAEGSYDFRDPKVVELDGKTYMVCGSGRDGVGKILLYEQGKDLFTWQYAGVLFESREYGQVLECPDLFKLGDTYVLMFSQMKVATDAVIVLTGRFDGKKFTPEAVYKPEAGPQFYAPQTFLAPDGRRIAIGWMYNWGRPLDKGAQSAGALSLAREIKLEKGGIRFAPVREAAPLLQKEDPYVKITQDTVEITCQTEMPLCYRGRIGQIEILRDTKSIEVFINGGEKNFSVWFAR